MSVGHGEPSVEAWVIKVGLARELARLEISSDSLLVLPTHERGGAMYYSPDDVTAALEARAAGVAVAFADGPDRRYLNEFAAGEMVVVALAVLENLTASGLIGIGRYLLARAGLILNHGLSLTGDVELEVSIAKLTRSADGDVSIEGLRVRGEAVAATRVMLTALAGEAAAQQALAQLEGPANEAT